MAGTAAAPGVVELFDGAVSPPLVETLAQIVRMPIWTYGQKSNAADAFGFWAAVFADSEPALEKFSSELHALWLCAKPLLKGDYRVDLAYANGQTYGQSGEIHTDSDASGDKTVLYYCNTQWQPSWAGETVFYTPDRAEIMQMILPRPGRLLVFDSDIPHAGRDPSRVCPVMRVTIAFKVRPAGSAVRRA